MLPDGAAEERVLPYEERAEKDEPLAVLDSIWRIWARRPIASRQTPLVMAEQTSNRFLVRGKRLRVATIATAFFPDPTQLFAYELVRRLCDRIGAEMCVAASEPADPTQCDSRAKAWLENGLFSPPSDLVHAADLAHFRRTRPEAVDRLLDELAQALGKGKAQVADIPEVKIGISLARWLEAWAPDLLVSFYSFAGSLWAHTAARLLDVPRVWIAYTADLDRPENLLLTSIHCRYADLVITRSSAIRIALGEHKGDHWIDMDMYRWELQWSGRVARLLGGRTRAASRQDLGLASAYRRRTPAPTTQAGAKPFVVLGAERTGSNLLIEMLATHPRVHASGELCNTRAMEADKLDVLLPEGLDEAEMLELRRTDPGAAFDRLVQAAFARGFTTIGFKLLYYHGLAVDRMVEHLLAMPSLRVVHLVREDAVERWISQARAERSDRWWSATERPSHQPPRSIELPPRETLVRLEANRQWEELFRALFADHPVLELSYEQLASDLDTQVLRVQEFLGLEPRPLVAESKKTGIEDPRQLVSNWGQLVEAFTDTRWRGMFPSR